MMQVVRLPMDRRLLHTKVHIEEIFETPTILHTAVNQMLTFIPLVSPPPRLLHGQRIIVDSR